jgi:hypothetical protein
MSVTKREREIANRKRHSQEKQNRRNAPVLERAEEARIQREKILIVCEGRNTEPSYFKQFHSSTTTIETIEIVGEGYNTLSLVNRAEYLKNSKYPDYQVWCVFDADPKPTNPQQLVNFNDAIKKAELLGYYTAYSHQAFEYWLILHFEDHQGGAMDRKLYYDKINKYLTSINPKAYYDKDSKIITERIFNILLGIDKKTGKTRQQIAIERAKKIFDRYDHKDPASEESSTTVFKLVKKLNNKE